VTGPDGTVLAEAVNGVLRLIATSLRRADSSAPIWGCVEIERTDERNLRAINAIDMETYVQGVVLSEMGAKFPLEALKAQAVAARSYAWAKITEARRRGDTRILRRTDVDQVFRATDVVPETIRRAVRETRGELLGDAAGPLVAYYHSTCGGKTRSAATDFAPSSPIRGASCDHCRHSRYYTWRRAYGYRFLAQALAPLAVKAPVRAIDIADAGPDGRVTTFSVTHAGGTTSLRGHQLRGAINRIATNREQEMLSTFVTLARTPSGIRMSGHGWGHGVGMCQMGAATLARTGLDYREILGYYYTGIPLSRGWGRAEP
jgi:stage II sporulation protein D